MLTEHSFEDGYRVPDRLLRVHHQAARIESRVPAALGLRPSNDLRLLPLAILVALSAMEGMIGILVAYTPLVVFAPGPGVGSAD